MQTQLFVQAIDENCISAKRKLAENRVKPGLIHTLRGGNDDPHSPQVSQHATQTAEPLWWQPNARHDENDEPDYYGYRWHWRNDYAWIRGA
jgi:hypothetical protein